MMYCNLYWEIEVMWFGMGGSLFKRMWISAFGEVENGLGRNIGCAREV
jgi:hypothetical protein